MYTEIFIPVFATISGCAYYLKNNKPYENNVNNVNDEDIELLESEIDADADADCPVIFFDNNGNYYYVYK